MKPNRTLATLVVFITLFLGQGFAAKVGEAAPDFTLTDMHGETHSLSDYAGKIVVLEWTNYGCPYVKKHYVSGNMQSLQVYGTAEGVVWLTICSSAPGKQGHMSPEEWVEATKEKNVASTAVLLDESGDVGRLYGARTTPHMYVIGKDGILAYNGAIDSISSTDSRDIGMADNYVKDAVVALMKGEPIAKEVSKPYGCSVKY